MSFTQKTYNSLGVGLADFDAAIEIQNQLSFPVTGSTFYIDPTNGSDQNSGTAPDDAKLTPNAVIGLCTANKGDLIVWMRGSCAVTETVAFDVTGVTLVVAQFGGPKAAMGEYNAIYAASTFTDGPVVTITATTTIIGLGMASRDATATFYGGAACLIGGLTTAAPYGVHLYKCRFPKWGLDNRIGLSIEGGSDILIEECEFEGVGADFEAGIYLQGATANLEVRGNRFTDCDYAMEFGAITGSGPGPDLDFHHNRVITPDSKGIDTNTQTCRGIIYHNWFTTDAGASTFDRTTADLETAGIILTDNHYATEATGPT